MKIYALGNLAKQQNTRNEKTGCVTFGFYNPPPSRYIPPTKEEIKMKKYEQEAQKFLTSRAKQIFNNLNWVNNLQNLKTNRITQGEWIIKIMEFVQGWGKNEMHYSIEKYFNAKNAKGTKPVKIVTTKQNGNLRTTLTELEDANIWSVDTSYIKTK
ncbi:MAG: hypothetical protein WCY19_02785 [Candidatus Gastranaerophilaceae bacterium]